MPRSGVAPIEEHVLCGNPAAQRLARETIRGARFCALLGRADCPARQEYCTEHTTHGPQLVRLIAHGSRLMAQLSLGDVAAGMPEVLHYVHDTQGSVVGLTDAGDPTAQPDPIPAKLVERRTPLPTASRRTRRRARYTCRTGRPSM